MLPITSKCVQADEQFKQLSEDNYITKQDFELNLQNIGVDRSACGEGEKAAANYIADTLDGMGLDKVFEDYHQTFVAPNGKSQNVVAKIAGNNSTRQIVIGAHYDNAYSLFGKETQSNGVYDNLSGVTLVLKLAQLLKQLQLINSLPCDVLVAFYGAEEIGMLGSSAFVKYLNLNNYNIACSFNFDSIGAGESLYYYSGECLGSQDRIIENVLNVLDLPFKFSNFPANKKSNYLINFFGTCCVTAGLQSDNISYLEGNIASTTFFSGNLSSSSQFVESQRNDSIHHTDKDNIDVLFSLYPDCLGKINSVLTLAYACISSEQILSINQPVFNLFALNNRYIICAIGLLTLVIVLTVDRHFKRAKTKI